jgi:hypothetical protein
MAQSRGHRAALGLDLWFPFARREQDGLDVKMAIPGSPDPGDLVSRGDPPDRGRPHRVAGSG